MDRAPSTPIIEDGGEDRGPYLRLTFDLSQGAYATGVTREIGKQAPSQIADFGFRIADSG